jgi:hypothetical protein
VSSPASIRPTLKGQKTPVRRTNPQAPYCAPMSRWARVTTSVILNGLRLKAVRSATVASGREALPRSRPLHPDPSALGDSASLSFEEGCRLADRKRPVAATLRRDFPSLMLGHGRRAGDAGAGRSAKDQS